MQTGCRLADFSLITSSAAVTDGRQFRGVGHAPPPVAGTVVLGSEGQGILPASQHPCGPSINGRGKFTGAALPSAVVTSASLSRPPCSPYQGASNGCATHDGLFPTVLEPDLRVRRLGVERQTAVAADCFRGHLHVKRVTTLRCQGRAGSPLIRRFSFGPAFPCHGPTVPTCRRRFAWQIASVETTSGRKKSRQLDP